MLKGFMEVWERNLVDHSWMVLRKEELCEFLRMYILILVEVSGSWIQASYMQRVERVTLLTVHANWPRPQYHMCSNIDHVPMDGSDDLGYLSKTCCPRCG